MLSYKEEMDKVHKYWPGGQYIVDVRRQWRTGFANDDELRRAGQEALVAARRFYEAGDKTAYAVAFALAMPLPKFSSSFEAALASIEQQRGSINETD